MNVEKEEHYFLEGYFAYAQGKLISDNPYEPCEECDWWNEGYLAAKLDYAP